MDLLLKGKKALVTGSSSGIGESIAKCLAKEGVQVMVHGRKEDQLKRVVSEIRNSGGSAEYALGDLSRDEDARKVAEKSLAAFGQLDILINNAGAFPRHSWSESAPQDWLDLFNINVVSMVRMIQAFLPQMRSRGWGRIIQIASVAGISPQPDFPSYGVTKAANINLTISLAAELAGTGITANVVSPGPIATPGVIAEFSKDEKSWAEVEKKLIQSRFHNLVGRFGKPEDVGNLVTFLSSPLAGYITGANFRVDGGRGL